MNDNVVGVNTGDARHNNVASNGTSDFAPLVQAARKGDPAAKRALVESLQRLVWHTTAKFSLSTEDRQDVFAGTFCRLFERLDTIREPERLPGWIARTARNEALTLIRARGRIIVSGDLQNPSAIAPAPDEQLLDHELLAALHAGMRELPEHCQELLRLVCAEPRLSYQVISDILHLPRGSIGPNRQRYLERLRNTAQIRAFLERPVDGNGFP